ncbi:MAG TPA: TauD/TfdA family dioxygenase [Propionibacteriaceae bacterium]
MQVCDIAPAIGARISGVHLDRLGTEGFADLLDVLDDRQVICVEGQDALTPAGHLAFARRLGVVEDYPFGAPLAGHPGIFRIVKERDSASNFGGVWHTDSPYHAIPPSYTVLRGIDIPRSGGDTLVASMRAAYEALPTATQERIAELDGVFTASKVHGTSRATNFSIGDVQRVHDDARADQTFAHPLVRAHPRTGRPGLYVSACHMTGVLGLGDAEAETLVDELSRHIVDDRFTGRIRWSPGLVVVIDNRCVQHYALNDYQGQRREIHRVLVGDGRAPSRELTTKGVLDALPR